MKKILIPFLFLAAVATASAHCGACGTSGEKAHKVEAKLECTKSKEACDKTEKAACTKDGEKACCAKTAAPAAACCPKS
ncbi:MAG: hypothetical protein ACI81V_001577 [Lentimonas sp.]|jgi:hypothetical protein